jgi:hypothetical protein
LLIPSLYEHDEEAHESGLAQSLGNVFSHQWHSRILFSPDIPNSMALSAPAMLYLISASLWDSNLRFLDNDIKQISFRDLRKPSVQVNAKLHDRREDLYLLKGFVQDTRRYMSPDVVEWYESNFAPLQKLNLVVSPAVTFERLIGEADKLSDFLMDSFQLLMSTMSTLDAQTSLEQAARGARLTWLAFIYAPLSFVTGIYGMNVKEINDSPLSVWVTAVTLFILAVSTGALLVMYDSYPKLKKKIQLRKEKYINVPRREREVHKMRQVQAAEYVVNMNTLEEGLGQRHVRRPNDNEDSATPSVYSSHNPSTH